MAKRQPETVYVFRWGKYMPWKGRMCVIEARGKMNSALVRFTDNGQRAVVSRNALSKA